MFLHRVVDPIDIRVYQEIVPLPGRQVEEMVSSLRKGEAIFLAEHAPQRVLIRLRDTYHAGSTPELEARTTPELRKIDQRMLIELRELAQQVGDEKDDIVASLEAQLLAKEKETEEQRATIAGLQSQIAILSKLSLSLEELPIVVTFIR